MYIVFIRICVVCEGNTHLVISQSHQDDVWRVNPDLEETNRSEITHPLSHSALCDPQWVPCRHITGGSLTTENTPTQHPVRRFPVCAGRGKRCERTVGTFLPFFGVFLWCDRAAWFHQSTWPPDARSPTSLSPEHTLEETRQRRVKENTLKKTTLKWEITWTKLLFYQE